MIEMMIYTLVGIFLYFVSDWILLKSEQRAGRQFENRNMIFFGIIMALAMAVFTAIRLFITNI